MNFEERKDLISFFSSFEENFPVSQWKLNQVDIWPILKIALFLRIFNGEQVYQRDKEQNIFAKRLNNLKALLRANFFLKTWKFKASDYLFTGDLSHRIELNGVSFNRYFDPMIDFLEEQGQSSNQFEYGDVSNISTYKSERVRVLKELLPVFAKRVTPLVDWNETREFPGFAHFLEKMENRYGLNQNLIEAILMNKLRSTLAWAALFEEVIKRTNAKVAFSLCYYTTAGYGLNLAARKANIVSVDMQHGGQGPLHTAYYFKSTLPQVFNTLPHRFWVWDKSSLNNILTWASGDEHLPVLGGNPWNLFASNYFDYIDHSISDKKPLILISTQTMTPPLQDFMLSAILMSVEKYQWWIRLHPRMAREQRLAFEKQLEERGILGKVEIDNATNLPFIYLLGHCHLHISRFSGTILESLQQGVPTLVTDRVGAEMYPKDDFEDKMLEYYFEDYSATEELQHKLEDMIQISLNKQGHCLSKDLEMFRKGLKELGS